MCFYNHCIYQPFSCVTCGSHYTNIADLLYCCFLFIQLLTEKKSIPKAVTPISRENQIKHCQLHLNSNNDEISIPNSPLTSSSFEDCIISATFRKHLNIFLIIVLMNKSVIRWWEHGQTRKCYNFSSHTPIPSKNWKFVKTEDDAISLPDPFPLPKHYNADVEVALASGKMMKETVGIPFCCCCCNACI